jgi:hypothetical protein
MLAFLLTGCWVGQGLFSDRDAKRVIEPGVYRSAAPGEEAREVRVSILPTGLTRMSDPADGENEDDAYGFSPLDGGQRKFVGWFSKENDQNGERVQIYFLLQKVGPAAFTIYIPECKGATGALAKTAGASVDTGTAATCAFRSKDAVKRAMLQLRPDASELGHLVRIGS